jgi:hypothetical protein
MAGNHLYPIHPENIMRKLKQAAMAAAAVAALAAAPTYGQTGTTNVWSGSIPPAAARADERASAVIRIIDADARTGAPVAIDTAELARGRAAGEIQATEGTAAYVLERIRPRAGQAAIVDAASDARANAQATARFDDVARSREHAKYEADKKRRAAEAASRASMQARADAHPRAEISWSPTEQPSARVVESETRARAGVSAEAAAQEEDTEELR